MTSRSWSERLPSRNVFNLNFRSILHFIMKLDYRQVRCPLLSWAIICLLWALFGRYCSRLLPSHMPIHQLAHQYLPRVPPLPYCRMGIWRYNQEAFLRDFLQLWGLFLVWLCSLLRRILNSNRNASNYPIVTLPKKMLKFILLSISFSCYLIYIPTLCWSLKFGNFTKVRPH